MVSLAEGKTAGSLNSSLVYLTLQLKSQRPKAKRSYYTSGLERTLIPKAVFSCPPSRHPFWGEYDFSWMAIRHMANIQKDGGNSNSCKTLDQSQDDLIQILLNSMERLSPALADFPDIKVFYLPGLL